MNVTSQISQFKDIQNPRSCPASANADDSLKGQLNMHVSSLKSATMQHTSSEKFEDVVQGGVGGQAETQTKCYCFWIA